jgi:hypothetical protein
MTDNYQSQFNNVFHVTMTSMRDCSEKSILTKQINNSIYLSANRTFSPLISLSDIVCINKLTLILRIICHCDQDVYTDIIIFIGNIIMCLTSQWQIIIRVSLIMCFTSQWQIILSIRVSLIMCFTSQWQIILSIRVSLLIQTMSLNEIKGENVLFAFSTSQNQFGGDSRIWAKLAFKTRFEPMSIHPIF